MRRFAPCLASWGLLALLLPAAAGAQSMFLDSDGDGAPTVADVIAPTGVTTLAVWIRTDVNRDGSAATCATADGDLTISGYEFILHASNGTVSWAGVTNEIPAFGPALATDSDDVDLHAGAYGASQPPGSYLLATVQVSVASGTPRLDIVPTTPLGGTFLTGFGSSCSGTSYDNTLKLGEDWFDADGAAYGGAANRAPTLDPVPDLEVAEGDTLDQALTAHDPDGDPIQFVKTAGPVYATVSTVTPGSGVATGLLRLTPGFADSGSVIVSFEAGDGIATTAADARVRIVDRNRPPSLEPPADMTAVTGLETVQDLVATDPDGGALEFLLVSGPAYATVTTTQPFSPATGRIRLVPTEWNIGPATAVVGVTDGGLQAVDSLAITVVGQGIFSPLFCRPYDMTIAVGTTAEQVLLASTDTGQPLSFSIVRGPGFVSVTSDPAGPPPQTGRLLAFPSMADLGVHAVSLRATAGGTMTEEAFRITVVDHIGPAPPVTDLFAATARSYDVCHLPQSVALADLNEDGIPDVVTAHLGCGVTVMPGIGNGRFAGRRSFRVDGVPKAAQAADFDGDGHLDVAVATGLGNQVVVLRGDGTGSLAPAVSLPAGPNASYVAAGDLNHDGIPDLVSSNENASSISIFLGEGGFAFAAPVKIAVGSTPCFTRIADVNHDGHPDLLEANEGSSAVTVVLGGGDGTFRAIDSFRTAAGASAVDVGDFDGDGNVDLVAAGFDTHYLSVLFGDGTGVFSRREDLDTGSAPWSAAAVDLNGDGRPDLASADTGAGDVRTFLNRGDGTFAPAVPTTAGTLARYVIGSDLNHDGRMDLLVANEGGACVTVLFGNGDGTFGRAGSYSLPEAPLTFAEGDLNGDGRLDVAVGLYESKTIQVRFGVGDGTLGAPSTLSPGATSNTMAVADLDGDGVEDLIVGFREAGSIAIYRGGGTLGQAAPLSIPTSGDVSSLAVGDWNGDGAPDLAFASALDPIVVVVDGDGAGGFTNRREVLAPMEVTALATGDFDGDGHPDLAAGVGRAGAQILWGNGTGFDQGPTLAEESRVSFVSAADLDQDGKDELIAMTQGFFGGQYLMAPQGVVAIYRWSTREAIPVRTFYPAGAGGRNPLARDVTGDGRPDLLFVVAGSSAVGVLPMLPDGSFGEREDYGAGSLPIGWGLGDLNGDGRPDAVTADFLASTLTVLLNVGSGAPAPLAARAFVKPDDRTLRLQSAKPVLCVHVEPVDGNFSIWDVDPTSLRMTRTSGSHEPIAASVGKQMQLADADRNGVDELTVCFAKEDLRQLFADVRGAKTLPVAVEGSLADGRGIRAELSLGVVGGPGGPLAAWLAPNPLNPTAVLTFTTAHEGPVRIVVFDVQGRQVARLYQAKRVAPGEHRIAIGGGAANARSLASGVYFYRIESPDGDATGRFVVLK